MQNLQCGLLLRMFRGLCVSVCVSIGYNHELYKNSSTDRDAVWGVDSGGPPKSCIMGPGPPMRRGNFRKHGTYRQYIGVRLIFLTLDLFGRW